MLQTFAASMKCKTQIIVSLTLIQTLKITTCFVSGGVLHNSLYLKYKGKSMAVDAYTVW